MKKRVLCTGTAKALSFVLAVFIVLQAGMLGVGAAEVTYSGRGSKSDPFLIQTAEQLNGIRNNLNAHYKLANTVDLSGYSAFTPIGSVKTPFKGSLVCDADSGGKPLYAIKNLKVNISPKGATLAEKYSGYKKDGSSGWEAGLFGSADGAAFTNILVLDANIVNNVEGASQVNGDNSPNYGMDEQAAGILLAIGKNITVKGCGVSGTVTSDSNHVGGMLGIVFSGNIQNSYSYATVVSTGYWGGGGFIGSGKNGAVSISSCFYNGDFTGGFTHMGAFGGSVYEGGKITIKDCWAGGTVASDLSGCFAGVKNRSDSSTLTNTDVASQCYTVSKVKGRAQTPTNPRVKNHNYAAAEPGVLEVDFGAATQEAINEVFKSFSAWTVSSGSYPQLKNVYPVTDSSVYQVQTVTDTGSQPSGTSGTQSGGEDAPDTESQSDDPEETEDGKVIHNISEQETLVKVRQAEKVLIITLVVLILLSVAGSVVTIVMMYKKRTL